MPPLAMFPMMPIRAPANPPNVSQQLLQRKRGNPVSYIAEICLKLPDEELASTYSPPPAPCARSGFLPRTIAHALRWLDAAAPGGFPRRACRDRLGPCCGAPRRDVARERL